MFFWISQTTHAYNRWRLKLNNNFWLLSILLKCVLKPKSVILVLAPLPRTADRWASMALPYTCLPNFLNKKCIATRLTFGHSASFVLSYLWVKHHFTAEVWMNCWRKSMRANTRPYQKSPWLWNALFFWLNVYKQMNTTVFQAKNFPSTHFFSILLLCKICTS